MKSILSGLSALVMAGAAGCAMQGDDMGGNAPVTSASAELRDAAGRGMGRATATQAGDAIRFRVEGINMPPGSHGAHVHMVGRCDGPGFESAGGHWNPTNRAHGRDNPQGMHKGDLPNLVIGAVGNGSVEYTVNSARVRGGTMPMLDGDGAAMVIHASADDYRSDPSGNSGARIACGVLG